MGQLWEAHDKSLGHHCSWLPSGTQNIAVDDPVPRVEWPKPPCTWLFLGQHAPMDFVICSWGGGWVSLFMTSDTMWVLSWETWRSDWPLHMISMISTWHQCQRLWPQQALWGFCVQLSPGLIDFIVTWQTEQNIFEYQTHPQKKASSNFQTNQLGPGRVTYVLLASVRGKTCLCNCNHRNIHSFRCFAGTYSSEPSLQTGYSAIGQSTKT